MNKIINYMSHLANRHLLKALFKSDVLGTSSWKVPGRWKDTAKVPLKFQYKRRRIQESPASAAAQSSAAGASPRRSRRRPAQKTRNKPRSRRKPKIEE